MTATTKRVRYRYDEKTGELVAVEMKPPEWNTPEKPAPKLYTGLYL